MNLYAVIPKNWKPENTKAINKWFNKIEKSQRIKVGVKK